MSIKAADAEQLLNNPRLQQAFANVKEGIVAQMQCIPLGQANSSFAQELVISLQLIEAIQRDIENDILDGVMENADEYSLSIN